MVSLEGLMLKLKLQYLGHLMWRVDSLGKTLMLGGIGGRRRRGWQRMRWLDGITDSMDMSLGSWWWTGRPGVLRLMGSQRVRHDWATELNWTEWCPSPFKSIHGFSCNMQSEHGTCSATAEISHATACVCQPAGLCSMFPALWVFDYLL